MGETVKCTVRDGKHVEPCASLEANCDIPMSGFSKAKGIARWAYTNLTTHKPSRTFFGVKSKANPNGFLFNFCPLCGEQIDAPFVSDEEQPA